MYVPVDVFEPAQIFIATGEMGVVAYPMEEENMISFESEDDDKTGEVEVQVGEMRKVVVGPDEIAVLGSHAIQFYDACLDLIYTRSNDEDFTDIAWSDGWTLCRRIPSSLEFFALPDPGADQVSKVAIGQDSDLYGLFDPLKWRAGSFSVDDTHVVFKEKAYKVGSGEILCVAQAVSKDAIAVGTKDTVCVFENDDGDLRMIEEVVKVAPLTLAFYEEDESIWFVHDEGVSSIDLVRYGDPPFPEGHELGNFTGNRPGHVVGKVDRPDAPKEPASSGCCSHEAKITALEAQVAQLKQAIENMKPKDWDPVVTSYRIDERFEVLNAPKSIKEALQVVFSGDRPYYYFEVYGEELLSYLQEAPPSTAQLLRLALIEAFPSSELADQLFSQLGDRLESVDARVFDAIMAKYRVYEEFKQ